MKKLTILAAMIFFVCLFAPTTASPSRPDRIRVRPGFKTKTVYSFSNEMLIAEGEGNPNPNIKYVWDYDINVEKTKSGFVSSANFSITKSQKYVFGENEWKLETEHITEPMKFDGEFDTDENNFGEALKLINSEESELPINIYRLILGFSYVYLHSRVIECGTAIDASETVNNELKDLLGFEYKTDINYQITGVEELNRRNEKFGINNGGIFRTSMSWRNSENDGAELRGLAIFDSRARVLSGYKAHAWVKHKEITNDKFWNITLSTKLSPPDNFKDEDSLALFPLPLRIPKKFPEVGSTPPDFKLFDLDGKKEYSLSDFYGKVVILDFWATWCPPCRTFMAQNLKPWHDKYGDKGLKIVCIGTNWQGETAGKQKQFAERLGYDWLKLFDKDGKAAKDYGVTGIPHVLLLDKNGKVVLVGRDAAFIEKYLSEHCK